MGSGSSPSKRTVLGVVGCAGAGCLGFFGVMVAAGLMLGRALEEIVTTSSTAAPPLSTAAPPAPTRPGATVVDFRFAPEITAPDRAALIEAAGADVPHLEGR